MLLLSFVSCCKRFTPPKRRFWKFGECVSPGKHFSTLCSQKSSTHTLEECFPWKRTLKCLSDLPKSSFGEHKMHIKVCTHAPQHDWCYLSSDTDPRRIEQGLDDASCILGGMPSSWWAAWWSFPIRRGSVSMRLSQMLFPRLRIPLQMHVPQTTMFEGWTEQRMKSEWL